MSALHYYIISQSEQGVSISFGPMEGRRSGIIPVAVSCKGKSVKFLHASVGLTEHGLIEEIEQHLLTILD